MKNRIVFNVNEAIQYGQLLQAAYCIPPNDLTQRAGMLIDDQFDPLGRRYIVLSSIFGSDLITDWNPLRAKSTASYGFVLQDKEQNVVIALRGTEGIAEWMHDAAFLQKPFPKADAGSTEDGFTTVYETLSVDAGLTRGLSKFMQSLPIGKPIGEAFVCGHSLGGALATMLSMDLSVNEKLQVTIYTYASPRVGDPEFADAYSRTVTAHFRIANQLDLVPKLPLQNPPPPLPQYQHVGTLVSLNPFGLPAKIIPTIRCEHLMSSYQYLLTELPGLVIDQKKLPQVDPACILERPLLPLLLQ